MGVAEICRSFILFFECVVGAAIWSLDWEWGWKWGRILPVAVEDFTFSNSHDCLTANLFYHSFEPPLLLSSFICHLFCSCLLLLDSSFIRVGLLPLLLSLLYWWKSGGSRRHRASLQTVQRPGCGRSVELLLLLLDLIDPLLRALASNNNHSKPNQPLSSLSHWHETLHFRVKLINHHPFPLQKK